MQIKEAKWEHCPSCGTKQKCISDEEYGCDECKKPININVKGKRHNDYLDLTVFENPSAPHSRDYQLCSWKCVLKKLRKLKCGYFISLPYLHFEKDALPGQRARDFFKELKR